MNKPRLIDANFIEKYVQREEHHTPDEKWRPESEFVALIDAQPTAYDIDKVVAQLEDLKKHEADGSCPKIGMCIKGAESCATCYTDTAIEIVKGGADNG